VQRVALIVNPFATRVTEPVLRAVEHALAPKLDVELLTTGGRGHAVELAKVARTGHDAVLVFSGDGVFNEVLNGIDRDVPVGFLPGGRTNVLPRALGIPRDPVAAAARLAGSLEKGRTRRISLGRANGRRFAFAAGVGVDAELIRRVDERGRTHDGRLPGDLAVGLLFARQLGEAGGYEPALEVAGLGWAASALVGNCETYTYAGPFPLRFTPNARFELGLDIVAPRSLPLRAFAGIAVRALRGRPGGDRFLYGHDLDRIEVTCVAPMPLQTDGEDLGDVTAVVFEAERRAVSVLV
jgi:diacylglycerol kinase family enzyme